MEYGLAKHSRKKNLTKNDIPSIVKPVIDAVQAIFPHQQDFEECRVQRKGNQCSIGEEKQNNRSTGRIRPASSSASLSSIAPNQIEPKRAVVLAVVMAIPMQLGTMGIIKIVLLTRR